jgi:hypothetical protein
VSRQIIKTRPQRPYVIARVLIVLLLIAAALWLTIVWAGHRPGRHERANALSYARLARDEAAARAWNS